MIIICADSTIVLPVSMLVFWIYLKASGSLMAFLSMVLALVAIWKAAQSGQLLEVARDASSHNVEGGGGLGFLQDLTAY